MSSTSQNLQFLMAQLDEYLHSHEVGAGVLYVTNEGFRLPQKPIRANLEENMKFIEAQLEHYLHSHESVTLETCDTLVYGSNILRDPGFENATGAQGPNGEHLASGLTIAATPFGGLYWDEQPGTTPLADDAAYYDDEGWTCWSSYGPNNYDPPFTTITPIISTINPRSGSKHGRYWEPGGNEDEMEFSPLGGYTCAAPTAAYSCRIAAGDSITWSGYASVTAGASWVVYYEIAYFDSSRVNLSLSQYGEAAISSGAYTAFSISDTAPANAHYANVSVGVYWDGAGGASPETYFDLDDCSLAVTGGTSDPTGTTLYVTDEGFRFPYGWNHDGQIRDNMHFLETELTKYLHKHGDDV